MAFSLNNFEEQIDGKILERGKDYYERAMVDRSLELEKGKYECKVLGTRSYKVIIALDNKKIVDYKCNCPFDMGPICKHVVASLFHLRDTLDKAINLDAPIKQYHPAEKPLVERMESILQQIPHHELKDFVIQKALYDDIFRNVFLSSFAHLNDQESRKMYADQVDAILVAASDRDGYINWSNIYDVNLQVGNLIGEASKQLYKKNYQTAFWITTVVMEKMTEALQFSDDDGGIYECVADALDLFRSMAQMEMDKAGKWREEILKYCMDAYNRKIYAEWETHFEMLEIAADMVKEEEEIQHIFSLLDRPQDSIYDIEEAQVLKYRLLKRLRGEKVAKDYLEQHMENSRLRDLAINMAMEAKDFEKAKKIVLDDLQEEEEGRRFSKKWYDRLLGIAQAEEDKEDIVKYARSLYINSYHHNKKYYELLKEHVKKEEWKSFLNNLINEIKERAGDSFLADIYREEEYWDELMQLIKNSQRMDFFISFERYLPERFSEEVIILYAMYIVKYMENNLGRKYYRTVCHHLERMMELGGHKEAQQTIAILKEQYPSRRALMEELEKVGI